VVTLNIRRETGAMWTAWTDEIADYHLRCEIQVLADDTFVITLSDDDHELRRDTISSRSHGAAEAWAAHLRQLFRDGG